MVRDLREFLGISVPHGARNECAPATPAYCLPLAEAADREVGSPDCARGTERGAEQSDSGSREHGRQFRPRPGNTTAVFEEKAGSSGFSYLSTQQAHSRGAVRGE